MAGKRKELHRMKEKRSEESEEGEVIEVGRHSIFR